MKWKLVVLELIALLLAADGNIVRARLVRTESSIPVVVTGVSDKDYQRDIVVDTFVDDEIQGPRPLLVLMHGRVVRAEERATFSSADFKDQAQLFAKRGFLVAIPIRIGYGATGGDDLEESGPCASKNFASGFGAASQEMSQVIDRLRRRSEVVTSKIVIVGYSYGGVVALATSKSLGEPIKAVVLFAPGSGANPLTPGEPCMPERMEVLFSEYGKGSQAPVLWINNENDTVFGPAHSHSWFQAFTRSGAVAQQMVMPPFGKNGHSFVWAVDEWEPLVFKFLAEHGFKQ